MYKYKVDIITNFVHLWIECTMFPLNLPNSVTFLFQKKLLPHANEVCKGYVFTHVCLSTGGGCYPSMPCSRSPGGRVVFQHALQVSRPTPRGEVEGDLARGISRPTLKGEVEGNLAWGVLQAHTWQGLLPGGLQAHTWGSAPRGVPAPRGALGGPPRDGYCCGRYASYWNAFLFKPVVKENYVMLYHKEQVREGIFKFPFRLGKTPIAKHFERMNYVMCSFPKSDAMNCTN